MQKKGRIIRTFLGGAPEKVSMVEIGEGSTKREVDLGNAVDIFPVASCSVFVRIMSRVLTCFIGVKGRIGRAEE